MDVAEDGPPPCGAAGRGVGRSDEVDGVGDGPRLGGGGVQRDGNGLGSPAELGGQLLVACARREESVRGSEQEGVARAVHKGRRAEGRDPAIL